MRFGHLRPQLAMLVEGFLYTCTVTASHYFTYGHRQLRTGHPVRSARHKQLTG
ncbi:hypothetical protein BDV97DRAFT_42144 [Delphinella strobiligena]|nr:hypothetical protein BDV97DRAFT_42144 [Delphinella strobiligena]